MESEKQLSDTEKAAMRVAVAQDVIDQLKSNKIRAANLGYVVLDFESISSADVGRDWQEILSREHVQCSVCAKGALFVAHALRFDAVKMDDLSFSLSHGKTCEPLWEYFEDSQLGAIEDLFEGWGSGCRQYCDRYPEPADRMAAIMQNVVDNGGTLVTPDDYVAGRDGDDADDDDWDDDDCDDDDDDWDDDDGDWDDDDSGDDEED